MVETVNSSMPLVSVVITTFGAPSCLKRAVDSVLCQTYPNIELIVVDDNGLDSPNHQQVLSVLGPYMEKNSLTLIPHGTNLNGSAARNTGFKASSGEFVAFLDDDDEFFPEKISKQIELLQGLDESWGGCYCQSQIFYSPTESFTTMDSFKGDLRYELLVNRLQCNTSTFFLRRSVVEALDGFDASFRRHQDWEFLMRFFRRWKLSLVDEVLVVRHREDGVFAPVGEQYVKMRENFMIVFKDDIQSLDRHDEILFQFYYDLSINLLRSKLFKMGFSYRSKASAVRAMNVSEAGHWWMVLFRNTVKLCLPFLEKRNKRSFTV